MSLCAHVVHETGHIASWKGLERRQQNVQKLNLHVQSVQKYCFSFLIMQISDFLVAVGVVA